MADEFSYPVGAELTAIGADFMGAMTLDDPIFSYFPVVDSDAHYLAWEQEDDFTGLQQIRGLNGEPPSVAPLGGKRYLYEPGVYGEFSPVDESELTRRREWGRYDGTIPIGDLTTGRQAHLISREVARIRWIAWKLATTGAFMVSGPNGAILHKGEFTLQSYNTAVPWATVATATPLADLRAVALKGRGKGVTFGRSAKAFANRATVNTMLGNQNDADLKGLRIGGGNTMITLENANAVYASDDVAQLEVMDDGYLDDSGTFQLYIPDGKVVVFGNRGDNARIGEYRRTRNANNPGSAAGSYDQVWESPKPPKKVEVHRGHNGGPVIYRPGSIVIMDVTHSGA